MVADILNESLELQKLVLKLGFIAQPNQQGCY
jgi:hypothetical protein